MPLDSVKNKNNDTYISWQDDASRKVAFSAYGQTVNGFRTFQKDEAAQTYTSSRTSYKDPFTKQHYDQYRPAEAQPQSFPQIIRAINAFYKQKNGIVRNTIDLMSDLVTRGIKVVHPSAAQQKFYRKWWERVNGVDRSERFANNLYRFGNVVIYKRFQQFPLDRKANSRYTKLIDKIDPSDNTQVKKYYLPVDYTFLDILSLNISGHKGLTNKRPTFQLQIDPALYHTLRTKGPASQKIRKEIPPEIAKQIENGSRSLVDLPDENVACCFYKKDDWETWATPFLNSIVPDLLLLEKLKLADASALDGAISKIRVFKLGDLEHKILPSPAMTSAFNSMLETNVGAGVKDIVWGPDISVLETSTDIHKFLGLYKYEPVLNAIYTGLGLPQTLTGGTSESGTTNNFVAIKTLLERLEYGRKKLIEFWNKEFINVQKAMGWARPAKLEFDIMSFGDEVAELRLFIELNDRQLVSDEVIQEKFGQDPEIERLRLRREERERNRGLRPAKSNPYNSPQIGYSMKQTALQQALLTPQEAGLSQDAKQAQFRLYQDTDKDGQVLDDTPEFEPDQKEDFKPTPKGRPGRPLMSPDTKERKKKQFRPKLQARRYQEIAKYIDSAYAFKLGKTKDELTIQELKTLGAYKAAAFLETPDDVKPMDIMEALELVDDKYIQRYNECADSFFGVDNYKDEYSIIVASRLGVE